MCSWCDRCVPLRGLCLLWTDTHAGELIAFELFILSHSLFCSPLICTPTLPPIVSDTCLLQNSDCFVIFFCLPISADNPESVC